MSNKPDNAQKKASRIRQGISAMEEILWLLESKKSVLKGLPEALQEQIEASSDLRAAAGQYASTNPNKHFLIGVLPRLFQDPKLFPSNEDIAEFAQTVLQMEIKRYEKRSKYELIGFIVCQTNDLDEQRLTSLVNALAEITGSQEKLQRIIEARKTEGLSWNEAIRQIGQPSKDDERSEIGS